MKLDEDIHKIMSRYLNRTETAEERQRLYQWFDDYGDSSKSIDEEVAYISLMRGKERLLSEITSVKGKGARAGRLSYMVAAACVALLCGLALIYFVGANRLTPLNQAELQALVPLHNKVTVTLANGKIIDLDKLKHNQPMSVGATILEEDELGQLVYTPGHGQDNPNMINTLQTAKASQYTVILSDGTKVYLNETSQLSYPEQFGTGDRTVKLIGEAYFEVQKTSQHSKFIVKTNGQSIEVLGTKFNVSAYRNVPFVKTTLSEGSVRISPKNKALKTLVLKPNQQATLNTTSLKSTSVNAKKIAQWKDGYFIFDRGRTDEVISEIGQWYGIEIEYDREKHAIEYEGRVPRNISLPQLIELLNYAGIKVQAFKDKDNKYKLIIN